MKCLIKCPLEYSVEYSTKMPNTVSIVFPGSGSLNLTYPTKPSEKVNFGPFIAMSLLISISRVRIGCKSDFSQTKRSPKMTPGDGLKTHSKAARSPFDRSCIDFLRFPVN
jgi:hypothetical protein